MKTHTSFSLLHRFSALGITFFSIVMVATGCSSFNRDWRESKVVANSFEGPWDGTWVSETSGHRDRLRCIVTRKSADQFEARYKARYRKIISFSYTTPLSATESNLTWHFKGEANLGKLAGGVYSYQGAASSSNYFSTYTSKYDQGIFQMQRPAEAR